MREIHASVLTDMVRKLCVEANYHLGDDVITAIEQAKQLEPSPVGQAILEEVIENAKIAAQ